MLQNDAGAGGGITRSVAGLDYAHLEIRPGARDASRLRPRASIPLQTDAEALAADERAGAGRKVFLPALESAHYAVAEAMKLAPKMAKTDVLMVNLSGRGDKDMGILARELDLAGAKSE